MTVDARRVALANADVMQHRRLFEELAVQFQFRMFFRNQQAAIRHLPTVNDKESPEFIVLRIVLVDYFTLMSTNLPPMAAGISTISPHFVWR